jgi:acyl-CoA synthetase (AMP-forming)/AMP-acid ligase II
MISNFSIYENIFKEGRMKENWNFARFCPLNASKFPNREFLIESWPSKGLRRVLTWKDLEEKTNKLANFLKKECGVKKGDIVLHLMMNSLEWYIAYMAVLKTGAAVAPLNFRFASADIKYSADATKCKVFILGDGFLPKVEPIMPEMPYIEKYICVGQTVPPSMVSYEEIMEKGDPEPILEEVEPDDMAELMFTSGTTGPPKPVCHTHKSLFYIAIGNALTYSLGYESVYIAAHPFYHSGSLFLSFPCYLAAGKIVMPMELQPASLIKTLAEEKCTRGWLTVPTWSDLLNAIEKGEIDPSQYDLSELRNIEIGAQPVPQVIFEKSKKIFPHIKMGNIYGITEGGGGGLTHLYDEDVFRKPGSIGKATAFMEAKVVDNEGKEVPPGVVGELILRGPRLMKEYAFNPEMTQQTIRDGWLYTGDLAYMDEEGYIFFADRKKDLIIRGGENIFPAEIEDFLRKHPKIKDVAVIGYPHPRLVEIAMAVIELKPGESMSPEEVLKFCEEGGLAKYKWPEKIVFAEVPRNPAGKIDKPKLREIYVKPALEAMKKEQSQG